MNQREWNRKKLLPLTAAGAFVVITGALVFLQGVPLPRNDEMPHLFQLDAQEARSVAVVGDFNDWDTTAHPLTRKNGLWQVTVTLRKGNTYFYNFVIDSDKWITDPAQLLISEDSFGKKSVLELDAEKEREQ